jgi:hypothetical protein
MTNDPLDPDNLTGPKHHNPKVLRPSTRKGAPPKTGASVDRSGDLSAEKPRSRDPYLPKRVDVAGYDPAWQDAIRRIAASEKRSAAAKKRGKQ